jgi:hypothetical protein
MPVEVQAAPIASVAAVVGGLRIETTLPGLRLAAEGLR